MRGIAVESKSVTRLGVFSAMLATGALLSGCVGYAPTYGTGVAADKQLFEDVSGLVTLAPKRGPKIAYKPRPELVASADTDALPPPQDDIVTASAGSGQWPESPEERRARLRAEATEHRDETNFRPLIRSGTEDPDGPKMKSEAVLGDRGANAYATDRAVAANDMRTEYRKRRKITQQGNATERNYLSEPPVEYRVPVDSAPAGELGEPELKKQQRLRAESRKKAGKTSWRDLLPWN